MTLDPSHAPPKATDSKEMKTSVMNAKCILGTSVTKANGILHAVQRGDGKENVYLYRIMSSISRLMVMSPCLEPLSINQEASIDPGRPGDEMSGEPSFVSL